MNQTFQILPQSGAAFVLKKNQLLKVIDSTGKQVSDLFCVDLFDRHDYLSSGRSIDYNDTIRLTTGHKLFSYSSHTMLEIIEDTCGVHDFLVTPCSLQMFQMLDSNCKYHASCEENLISAFHQFDLNFRHIDTTFNIFMNVTIQIDGKIKVTAPTSKKGDFILFKAHRDLIVGLTACSDENTNAGLCKTITYEILN